MEHFSTTEILSSLSHVWELIVSYMPRLLLAGAIFLLGWLIARVARSVTRSVITRVGRKLSPGKGESANLVEKQGARTLGTVAFWGVMFVAAMVATESVGLPVVTAWLGGFSAFLPRVALAVAIVVAAMVTARVFSELAVHAADSFGLRGAQRLTRLVRWTCYLLGTLVAMQQLGIDVSFITNGVFIALGAAVGGAALAFGLGSRNIVANILAMHYIRRNYRPGDHLELKDTYGRLVRMTPTGVVLEGPGGETTVPGDTVVTDIVVRKTSAS
jgi:small-conductance mechanosensitive channel